MNTSLNNSAVIVHQNMIKIPVKNNNNTKKNNTKNMNVADHHTNKTNNITK